MERKVLKLVQRRHDGPWYLLRWIDGRTRSPLVEDDPGRDVVLEGSWPDALSAWEGMLRIPGVGDVGVCSAHAYRATPAWESLLDHIDRARARGEIETG